MWSLLRDLWGGSRLLAFSKGYSLLVAVLESAGDAGERDGGRGGGGERDAV